MEKNLQDTETTENKNENKESKLYSLPNFLSRSSYHHPSYPYLPNSSPSLIHLAKNDTGRSNLNSIDSARLSKRRNDKKASKISNDLPLFFNYGNRVRVPKTIEGAIRHIPTHLLKEIHPKREVAIEMCLLFSMQLPSKYFGFIDESNPEGWKSLSSKLLRELFSYHHRVYKNIINALVTNCKDEPIIEVNENGKIAVKCNDYRLGKSFRSKKLVLYELRTEQAIRLLNKHYAKLYNEAIENPICNNLIQLYSFITNPTRDKIMTEAKRLVELDYSKKNKKLTFLNKHPRSYFKNPEQRSFVEDGIEIFDYLTENGLMIPRVGSEKSGGRIVDAFSRMPGWIRNLIRVNGLRLDVWDLTCLHPNIAMCLYGGSKEFLTHAALAKESGISEDIVKVEHLSFFNKHPKEMKASPLFEFYAKSEPKMMKNIINEKYQDRYKHKITSRRMFKKEVEIMTDVIMQLNKEGIYVLYIYDAIACLPNHSERVKDVLNDTVLKHGVKTVAKLSVDEKLNPGIKA